MFSKLTEKFPPVDGSCEGWIRRDCNSAGWGFSLVSPKRAQDSAATCKSQQSFVSKGINSTDSSRLSSVVALR